MATSSKRLTLKFRRQWMRCNLNNNVWIYGDDTILVHYQIKLDEKTFRNYDFFVICFLAFESIWRNQINLITVSENVRITSFQVLAFAVFFVCARQERGKITVFFSHIFDVRIFVRMKSGVFCCRCFSSSSSVKCTRTIAATTPTMFAESFVSGVSETCVWHQITSRTIENNNNHNKVKLGPNRKIIAIDVVSIHVQFMFHHLLWWLSRRKFTLVSAFVRRTHCALSWRTMVRGHGWRHEQHHDTLTPPQWKISLFDCCWTVAALARFFVSD